MPIPRITDHEARLLDRLIDEYRGQPERYPTIYGMLRAYARGAQDFEDAAYELLCSRFSVAVAGYGPAANVQMDMLGAIVGERRNGRVDAEYLESIKVRIRVNRSQGSTADIFEIVRLIVLVGAWVYEEGTCEFEVVVSDVTEAQISALGAALVRARAGGYRAVFVYSTSATPLRMGYNGVAPDNATAVGYNGAGGVGTISGSKDG